MNLVSLFFFLAPLFLALSQASSHVAESQVVAPHAATATPSQSTNISLTTLMHDACRYTGQKKSCRAHLKSLGGDEPHVDPNRLVFKAIRLAEQMYGDVAVLVRQRMKDKTVEVATRKALSHCFKMYLDVGHAIRAAILAVRGRDYDHVAVGFTHIGGHYPKYCEEGLKNTGTNGEKLGLYKSYKGLQEVASTCDSLLRYVAAQELALKDAKNELP